MESIDTSNMKAKLHVRPNVEPMRVPLVVSSSEKSITDTHVDVQQLDNLICEEPASSKKASDMRSQEEKATGHDKRRK